MLKDDRTVTHENNHNHVHGDRKEGQAQNISFPLPHIPSRKRQQLDLGIRLAI